jgi:predicted dienelactone hydrolase
MDAIVSGKSSVTGLGHSIGTTVLLAMAGGQAWMGPGNPVSINRDERLERLVLLTPATGFFQAPGALDGVQTPILAWVGTKDTITPPPQGEMLKRVLENRVRVDLRIEEGAGHFSFMHSPPPQVDETHSNREDFLARLTAEAVSFTLAE